MNKPPRTKEGYISSHCPVCGGILKKSKKNPKIFVSRPLSDNGSEVSEAPPVTTGRTTAAPLNNAMTRSSLTTVFPYKLETRRDIYCIIINYEPL